ncbi:hypothetical protein [Desulfovibrio litoralis]|uniref:Uncharacterized protein n=1 Tax=Desulfovibrio litoralis DSM 11393 TaxID=1121455 RepID=A0A1M7TD54_9BACT|nr:hypothetical protein [Desulfovibrio litoralis]SHN68704.1 hypothetical protein SAMN02745728_01876 [Desulfovibrio litoralis DSM 11393]
MINLFKTIIFSVLFVGCMTTSSYGVGMELDSFKGYHGDFSEYSVVFQCKVGSTKKQTISLLRGDPFYKGHFYAIKTGEKIEPLGKFLPYNSSDERDFGKSYSDADSIYVDCAGKDSKVLVIYGSFGGNRHDVLALGYNSPFKEYARIHLRTKAWIEHIYITPPYNKGMWLFVGGDNDTEYPGKIMYTGGFCYEGGQRHRMKDGEIYDEYYYQDKLPTGVSRAKLKRIKK